MKKKIQKLFLIDFITIIRGIACVIIVSLHSPLPSNVLKNPEGLFLLTIGYCAIYVFFFISGFVLGKKWLSGGYSLTRRGILTFYYKRLHKIIPMYYAVCLFLFSITPHKVAKTYQDLFSLLIFQSTVNSTIYSSGYLWFISVIMIFYLLTPIGFILLTYIARLHIVVKFILFLSLLFVGSLIRSQFASIGSMYWFYSESWSLNLFQFLSGMVFASLHNNVKMLGIRLLKEWRILLSFFGIAMFLVLFWILFQKVVASDPLTQMKYEVSIIPSVFYIFLAFILSIFPQRISLLFIWKGKLIPLFPVTLLLLFVQKIGELSFEIYLVHQIILNYVNYQCMQYCPGTQYAVNVFRVVLIAFGIAIVYKSFRTMLGLLLYKIPLH